MRVVKGITLVVAALLLAACDDASRFGGGGSGTIGAGTGIGMGGLDDPTSLTYFEEVVGDRVFFKVDESTLNAASQSVLDMQAAWLISNAAFTIVIEGHSDERGTTEYNIALGARRAAAVQEYLFTRGVPLGRIQTVSYGKERPVEICSDEICYSQNRRAVSVLRAGAGA